MMRVIIQDKASRLYFRDYSVREGLGLAELRQNAAHFVKGSKSAAELLEELRYHFGCCQWRQREVS